MKSQIGKTYPFANRGWGNGKWMIDGIAMLYKFTYHCNLEEKLPTLGNSFFHRILSN
jgi:hypothetical protein